MPTGLEPQWETWPANVSNFEHRCDPTGRRAWVPSPEAEPFPLPAFDDDAGAAPVVPDVPRAAAAGPAPRPRRGRAAAADPFKRRSPLVLLSLLRRRVFGREDAGAERRRAQDAEERAGLRSPGERRVATPAEWRAYGYWARPRIGSLLVRNATPPPSPRDLSLREIEEIMQSLEDADGATHPERWVARAAHPALPPRPALWPTPPARSTPLPAPALQLNPFLAHRLLGRPPLLFDLREHLVSCELGEGAPAPADPGAASRRLLLCPDGPDGAQPATCPPVRALDIRALADDTCGAFPWPMRVEPAHARLPVMVRDVLNALIANFEELLSADEVAALSDQRRAHMYRAYWERAHKMVAGRIPGDDDGLRRVDYLGDRAWFRGLEPAPDGDGFVLFVGPAP